MVRYPKGVYFLARPRRFGKSLLLSTLKEIFEGNRELFQGLWIHGSDYQWAEHPVIRIDFSRSKVRNGNELETTIQEYLQEIASECKIMLGAGGYQKQFRDLIRSLAAQNQAVILVDEYDKPIIDNIENVEEAQRIRDVLKGFYTVIKSMDEYLRFVFLTGVSKFSKVGVFSGLNNLEDITMSPAFAALPGITDEELRRFFCDYIADFAANEGVSEAALLEQIRRWYDGFCFAAGGERVYNPFSLLLLFKQRRFVNHWFETGTPTFLIKLLRERGYDVRELEDLRVDELAFSSYEVDDLKPVSLLFQTGYLTIKGYDTESRLYQLSYPNYEVENAFLRYLLDVFSSAENGMIGSYLWQLKNALQVGDFEQFFEVLHVFFAGIPYDIQTCTERSERIKQERYYQTIFYLIFKLMSLQVQAEARTSRGRIDALVELEEGVYIFEFKLEGAGDVQDALVQIKERGYAEPYRMADRPVYLIGAVFGTKERGVIDWAVEELET